MVHIHDLVDEYEHRLVARWTTTALEQGAVGVDETAHERIASFLKQLRAALSTAASNDVPSLYAVPTPTPTNDQPERDQERPLLESAVAARAFSALHCLLLELARDRGVTVSYAEQLTLASHVHAAITRAVELGSRQRDRDSWKAAHDIRNPLGSAMMATTMLRSRVDFGKDARLMDTLERNLKRVQGLVDELTARPGRPVAPVAPAASSETV